MSRAATPSPQSMLGRLGELCGYFAASAAALAVDISVMVLLVESTGTTPLFAAPLAFLAGLATIYLISTRLIFTTRSCSNSQLEFSVFLGIGLLGLGLNQAVIWLGTQSLFIDYRSAKLVAAAATFGFNFLLRKALLFTAMPTTGD